MGFQANDGYVGFGRQTVQGTGVVPTIFGRYLTAEGNAENEFKQFREGGFAKEGSFAKKVGMIFPFSCSVYARPDIAGLLATMALGSDTISGSGPYDHLIVPAALQWWSVEFERINHTLIERLEDCKVTTLTITGSAGEFLELAIEGQGLNIDASQSSATPSYEVDDILQFLHGSFVALGGAQAEIEEFTLTITNDIEFIQAGELVYRQAVDKFIDVTLDMTIKATQADEYEKIYFGGAAGDAPDAAAEAGQVVLTFNNGLLTTEEREIVLTIDELTYLAAPLTGLMAEGDVYRYAVSGIATNDGTNPLVQIDVKNDTATAYDGA